METNTTCQCVTSIFVLKNIFCRLIMQISFIRYVKNFTSIKHITSKLTQYKGGQDLKSFFYIFIYFIADLTENRIYWTDFLLGYIKSAKLDGSDVQLITRGLSNPTGIDVHDNHIYFTEWSGNLYKQSKSPGSSIIPLHSDTPNMESVKVYKEPGTYNIIALIINTLVSICQINVLHIYYLTPIIQ